jgi:uncharacterized membrane protein YraQ (UPF0718 family)
MTLAIIYGFLLVALAYSLAKDRRRTVMATKVGRKVLVRMLPSLVAVVGLVGLIISLVPPAVIEKYLGRSSGFGGTMVAAVVGAITLIPSLISIPLAASLLRSGATVMTIAAFITTLTMVGVVTAPLEMKELGRRFTLVRNGLSFIFALVIAVLMGVILT